MPVVRLVPLIQRNHQRHLTRVRRTIGEGCRRLKLRRRRKLIKLWFSGVPSFRVTNYAFTFLYCSHSLTTKPKKNKKIYNSRSLKKIKRFIDISELSKCIRKSFSRTYLNQRLTKNV